MATSSSRAQVLRLYREIIRLSYNWKALTESDTGVERRYIRDEGRRLFHKNKQVNDALKIQQCIEEAESRIELARHYGIPFPRPVNAAPNFVPLSKDKKAQVRRRQQAEPSYTRSLDK